MGALDPLQQQTPVRLLRQGRRLNDEIKSRQRTGSASINTRRIFSPATHDIVTPSSFAMHRILVEFTPDDLTFGGVFCHEMVAVADPTSPWPVAQRAERQRVTEDNVQRWILYTLWSNTPYKFYFLATGSGTFTASLL